MHTMELIRLSKEEKRILRRINDGLLNEQDKRTCAHVVDALARKQLVSAKINYDEVEDVRMTLYGSLYFSENPDLRNPVDRQKVTAWAAIVAAIASIVGLFVGCSVCSLIVSA